MENKIPYITSQPVPNLQKHSLLTVVCYSRYFLWLRQSHLSICIIASKNPTNWLFLYSISAPCSHPQHWVDEGVWLWNVNVSFLLLDEAGLSLLFIYLFIYLFIKKNFKFILEREEEVGGERERERRDMSICSTQLCIPWLILVCALTRN